MTNEEILKKAISKAIKNGYLYPDIAFDEDREYHGYNLYGRFLHSPKGGEEATEVDEQSVYHTIFSHDFAKAFWGDKETGIVVDHEWGDSLGDIWEHHLQCMVREEDPIKYLEKYIQ